MRNPGAETKNSSSASSHSRDSEAAYLAYLAKYQGTIFKPEKIAARITELAAAIRPAIAEESKEKLAQFDDLIAGEIS